MAIREFRKNARTIMDRSNASVTCYFHDINRFAPLSSEEEAELVRTIREGGPEAFWARERLIRANLKFVVSVANQYKSSLLELSDLISEGNIGLIKAVEMFDETKGFKFISYAVWWVRQSILKALADNGTFLRIPTNKQGILSQYKQMQEDMLQKEQRLITAEEFCEVSGYDYSDVVRVIDSSYSPVNMDATLSDDSEATYGDFMVSDNYTDSGLDAESLTMELDNTMKHALSPRESFVLKRLYGIGCESWPLDNIAKELNISRERIRQVAAIAQDKLRRSIYSSRLAAFSAA